MIVYCWIVLFSLYLFIGGVNTFEDQLPDINQEDTIVAEI